METQVLAESGPAVIALLVVIAVVAMLYAVRSRIRANSSPRGAKALARVRQKRVAQAEQQAMVAIGKDSERALFTDRVLKIAPDMDWLKLFDTLQDLIERAEMARAASEPDLLPEELTEMAREQVMRGHAMVDGVARIRHGPRWLLTADGNPSGLGIRIATTTWVDEQRGDQELPVESREHWHVGLPPEGALRIIGVERRWRTLLEPPVWNAHPREPVAFPRVEADLEERLQALEQPIDADALCAQAEQVAQALFASHTAQDTAALEPVATPAFVRGTRNGWHRNAHFGCHWRWEEVAVEKSALVRLQFSGHVTPDAVTQLPICSVWVRGTALQSLWRDGDEVGSETRNWVRYLTFHGTPEGGWLLDHIDDEDSFVV